MPLFYPLGDSFNLFQQQSQDYARVAHAYPRPSRVYPPQLVVTFLFSLLGFSVMQPGSRTFGFGGCHAVERHSVWPILDPAGPRFETRKASVRVTVTVTCGNFIRHANAQKDTKFKTLTMAKKTKKTNQNVLTTNWGNLSFKGMRCARSGSSPSEYHSLRSHWPATPSYRLVWGRWRRRCLHHFLFFLFWNENLHKYSFLNCRGNQFCVFV